MILEWGLNSNEYPYVLEKWPLARKVVNPNRP